MSGLTSHSFKKAKVQKDEPLEKDTLSSVGTGTVKKAGEAFADIGKGIFEQLMGLNTELAKQSESKEQPAEKNAPKRLESHGTIFSYTEIQERRQIREVNELIKQIKREVDQIKQADASMLEQVKDIEKVTLQSLPEKPGIYHIRILEVFLKLLQSVKIKINESRTWLMAVHGKRQGGATYNARVKQQGSAYANSQEHSIARSTQ